MIKTIITDSPTGEIIAAATDKGICLLEFMDRQPLEAEKEYITKIFNSPLEEGEDENLLKLKVQLKEYFAGRRKEFTLPLDIRGSDFQKLVWKELMNIPYGATRSYRQQADAILRPSSVRAVANANGMNKIAILIPCHRVIGSNGSLRGYGGGLERKRWLLEHEKKYSGSSFEQILF
jgi:AraC family transcriptional regulator of adaptative response/methylated-DNA-[protein]-cysteine methyltransferase